jgi:tetratricopeptide (TPR) repeat protein
VSPYWRLGRATVLLRLGRREEAEVELRNLLQTNPDLLATRLILIDSLASRGAVEEALGEIGPEVSLELAVRKIDILIRLQRLSDARSQFEPALARAQQPMDFESLLLLIPRLFEGPERRNAWLLFQSRTREAADANPRCAVALAPFNLRAALALRDYRGFMRGIDRGEESGAFGGHRELLRSVASTLRETGFPNRDKPKIFGIGLSKTGTTSLAAALSILGFTTLHFYNPLTGELMSDDDLYLFDGLTDTPVCLSFEEYYSMFPNAKFIYTTRRIQPWKESFAGHLQRFWGFSDFGKMKSLLTRRQPFHFGTRSWEIDQSLYFGHEGYEGAYRAYDRRVRSFFKDKPNDRFLEFSVFEGDGWERLCTFLGRPVPSTPFPWKNKAVAAAQID